MAARGAKVAVVTIDPARRLADALGLPALGNEEQRVDERRFAAEGLEMRGELWAMMLDAKRTFDELVERHARDERTRRAILENRIYQELSNAVAGSQEYMAMERLHELHAERRFDLLVLDTPPARNALDFLDAPERLSRFIDSRSLQFFLAPGRRGLKLASRGTGLLFSALERVTGIELLRDLSEFFQAFGDMAEGFSRRAREVNRLLTSDSATFVLVTTPEPRALDEARFFRRRLLQDRMHFGCLLVNRVHEEGDAPESEIEDELAGSLGADLAAKVTRNFEDYRALATRDRVTVAELRATLERETVITVPFLDDEVHDVRGLMRMNEHLFAAGAV
jgi:anion-transporting  ArsA/GET3 family ATPase